MKKNNLIALLLAITLSNFAIADIERKPEGIEHITEGSKPVSFLHRDLKIAANLYLPKNYEEGKKYPAIITMHPGGGVKEQTSGLYAKKLAEKGFITLAFDALYQGASEGQPRGIDIPAERIEDVRSAVDFLSTLKEVDKDKIGLVGICAGGGYTLATAQVEHRIKGVATISGVDTGELLRKGWDGKGIAVEAQLDFLKAVAEQRTAEANGAELKYTHIVPEKDEINSQTPNDIVEATDYYRTARGQYPTSNNLSLFSRSDAAYSFYSLKDIDTLLTQPLLLVVGSKAGSAWHSQNAYEKAATDKKELFVVEGATHMDLYDISPYVNQVVEKLDSFFKENLK